MRKLRDAVKKIAEEKGVKITGGLDGRLRDWDRELERTKDVAGAMAKIRGEFSYHLKNDDYKKIEKEI